MSRSPIEQIAPLGRRRQTRRGLARLLIGVLLVAGLASALAVGGFLIGRNVGDAADAAAVQSSMAFVAVEPGTVERTVSFSGEVAPQPLVDLVYEGAGTITAVYVADDTTLRVGEGVLEVDGLPVLLSDPTVFLPYRDLQRRDEGPDVAGLQRFLADLGAYDGEVTGKFDAATERAVEGLYMWTSGRKQSIFLRSSIILLDRERDVDTVHVAPGQVLATGTPIAALMDGAHAVVAEVTPTTGRQLTVDDVVWLEGGASGSRIEAVVHSISDPTAGADGRVLQQVSIRPVDDADIRAGEKFRVVRVLEQSEDGVLVAPALAVQTDAQGGAFVRVRTPGDDVVTSTRVDVELGVTDGTHVAITGAGITSGTMIEVPSGSNS